MSEWSFVVSPDIAVTIRARRRLPLLARCLGHGVLLHTRSDLTLGLGAELEPGAPAHGRYRGIPWECGVVARDGGLSLDWRSPILGEYLALHVALLPALRGLLLERDIALVAGSAFDIDGRGTVLCGETGAGKTSVLLAALAAGAHLVGDEYLGISTAGNVTPVLRAVALRWPTLAGVPQLRPRATRRLMLRAAELAARLSGLRLDPLVHVSPSELGISVADRASHITKLVFLERTRDTGPSRQRMEAAQAIEALARAQEAHDRAYAVPGTLAMGEKDVAGWRDVLARGLRDIECQRVTLRPGPLPDDVLRDLIAARQPAA